MSELADLSLVEAAEAVRNGDATSMELLEACWANMERSIRRLNATIWLDREGAERRPRAPPIARCGKGVARPAARRADDAQGHVLPGRQARAPAARRSAGIPPRRSPRP